MAGVAAEYAATRVKSRTLSPEQESAYSLRAAAAQVCFILATAFACWPLELALLHAHTVQAAFQTLSLRCKAEMQA